MSFSPSIGDVVLMAQIAWTLAQTFTKGRKSAPAEFCDVENQLYSLSAALEAIRRAQEKGDLEIGYVAPKPVSSGGKDESYGQNTMENILQNCLQTLKHLENIVKKYSVILQPTSSSARGISNWNQYVVRNWRKIEWTTEKGDLNALRSQIMIHTNSLNLLLGVAMSSQASGIRRSVETSSAMVRELYEWYQDNIKVTRNDHLISSSTSPAYTAYTLSTAPAQTFELSIWTSRGKETICPRAYFSRDWNQTSVDSASSEAEPMLACVCQKHGSPGSHQTAVQRYESVSEKSLVSHITFPARLAGENRSWILYKTIDKVTNQLVTLYITTIHPSYIQTLEEAILQDLAIRRADTILRQGFGNSLCYISADTGEERVLVSIGDLRTAQKSIESVTFDHGGRTYSRKYVENIQILQYQALSLGLVIKRGQTEPLQPLDYAEVFITYSEQDEEARSDVVSSTLHLKRNTKLKLDESHALVRIDSIETMGTFIDERTVSLGDVGITIQVTSKQAARELHRGLEDMRMELFIRSLRYPRSDESVVLRLQFARVECEYMCILDADVTVTVNNQGKHRLIIESRNKCTLMSQVLADDFFNSTSAKPNYTRPTYVVQYDEHGIRNVYKYERGFRYLNLGDRQGMLTSALLIFVHSLRVLYSRPDV
ncbi:hypothetical protein F4781DRAFT_419828 [Annulohypoxylon bovei var. microspora]|nr:hypothetical protein F4781DRAFT_419828 [Annulohypoxylon bovei var. microspora]